VFALLDTGATKSCVSEQVLIDLGAQFYSVRKQVGVNGVNGCYNHYLDIELLTNEKVAFATFTNIEVLDYKAGSHDGIQMLLGMDILGQFSEIRISGFEIQFGEKLGNGQ
jgi:predicted aspartyl protease